MGIIKAVVGAVGGGLADTWLEVIEPSDMDATTVMCPGVLKTRNDKRSSNTKGTDYTISNGSVIHVYDGQMMLLLDGGAVVDYSAEPGYFEVKNSSLPSLFNGQFGDSIKETFNRVRFGGATPTSQRVVYLNTRPLEGIKFGTSEPVSYYDPNYDIDVNVRAFGKFSVEIIDPLKFYKTIIPTSDVMHMRPVDMEKLISQRYDQEVITALAPALSQLSMQGVRISQVVGHTKELCDAMKESLKDNWVAERGIQLKQIGITINLDPETKELLKQRSQVAMFNRPDLRETMVQQNISQGIRDAGSNTGGAANAMFGIGMMMNNGGAYMNAASNNNMQQMQMMQQQQMQQQAQQPQVQQQAAPAPAAGGWDCVCGKKGNTGKFCAECGKPKPAPSGSWKCSCGHENTGKFCAECGAKRPDDKPKKIKCDKCGYEPDMSKPIPKFCPECGDPINESDFV